MAGNKYASSTGYFSKEMQAILKKGEKAAAKKTASPKKTAGKKK